MNKIFKKVPYWAREQAANKLYNNKIATAKVIIHLDWAWPVCEEGKCPWGVILHLLFPNSDLSELPNQPRPGHILDALAINLGDEKTTYKEVKDWTTRWDQGLISPKQLKKDLGVKNV